MLAYVFFRQAKAGANPDGIILMDALEADGDGAQLPSESRLEIQMFGDLTEQAADS